MTPLGGEVSTSPARAPVKKSLLTPDLSKGVQQGWRLPPKLFHIKKYWREESRIACNKP